MYKYMLIYYIYIVYISYLFFLFFPAIVHLSASKIDRCLSCYGYLNPFVRFSRLGWQCSICRQVNNISQKETPRLADERKRKELPELTLPLIEYQWTEEDDNNINTDNNNDTSSPSSSSSVPYNVDSDYDPSSLSSAASSSAPRFSPQISSLESPVYIFLVDLSGDNEYIELLKSSLLAAVEALPSSCWIGLAVFSSHLGLYNLRCSNIPHISYARIRDETEGDIDIKPLNISLSQILLLQHFLGKLGNVKDALSAAIESIQPHYQQQEEGEEKEKKEENITQQIKLARAQGGSEEEIASRIQQIHESYVREEERRRCGFGAALSSLLSYLTSDGYDLNARVLCFLSRLPNHGLGKLHHRYIPDMNAESDRELDDPQTDFYSQLASQASMKGICIDLFVVSNLKYCDLVHIITPHNNNNEEEEVIMVCFPPFSHSICPFFCFVFRYVVVPYILFYISRV